MDNDNFITNSRLSLSLEPTRLNTDKDFEDLYTKLLTINEIEELTQKVIKLYKNNVDPLEVNVYKSNNIDSNLKDEAVQLHERLNEVIGPIISDCDYQGSRKPFVLSIEDRNINEIKKLLTRNLPFDQFIKKLRQYHWAPRCNVVWRQNTVAYRCQTCGLNSCMSLCAECFENADHEGHDYSRFFSTVGGCCDCGNVDVILPSGFCKFHREDAPISSNKPPGEELVMLRYIIIKLLTRLLVTLRRWSRFKKGFISYSNKEGIDTPFVTIATNDIINKGILPIVNLFHEISEAGSVVTDILIEYLLDENFYKDLCSGCSTESLNDPNKVVEAPDWRLNNELEEDISSLRNLKWIREKFYDCHQLNVTCILDELIIYLIRIAYPQELIDLLLNLLYDTRYKELFAKKFFSYYPYTTAMVAELLTEISLSSTEGSKIAERIVHISVQICSGANICTWLQNEINIINCVIQSSVMMSLLGARGTQINHSEDRFYSSTPMDNSKTLEASRGWLNISIEENPFFIKNADLFVLTDTQNLLVHQTIAKIFFNDEKLVEKYIRNVEFYHGMGVEWRIVSGEHRLNDWTSNAQKCYNVEFEACSLPMHNLIQHITDSEDCNYFYGMLVDALNRWFSCINLENAPVDTSTPPYLATFHIPLHRHLANLLFHMQSLGDTCKKYIDHLRSNEHFLRKLVLHPMRIHAIRSEYYAGMWTRNGQGMRTAVSNYCKPTITFSFQSADLILTRFAAANINQEFFWKCVIDSFHILDCLNYPDDIDELDPDEVDTLVLRRNWISFLVDGALRLVLDLLIGRRDTEPDSDDLLKDEMIALLARQSLPYSHVKAVIPTRGNISFDLQMAVFDRMIDQVANFVEPDQNNSIQHGRFELKEEMYDERVCPIFSRLRSFGMVDYSEFTNKLESRDRDKCNPTLLSTVPPWIPFRMFDIDELYKNRFDTLKSTMGLLTQPSFFVLCFKLLQKINTTNYYHSRVFQQVIYLLTLSVQYLKSELFDDCKHVLFQPNECPVPAFPDETVHRLYSRKIRDSDDPRKIVREMFLARLSEESIFSLLIELFVKLVKKEKPNLNDTDALLELKNYINNDEVNKERLYGAGTQYLGRLLNNLFSLDDNIGREIRVFLNATKNEAEESMEVDTPTASSSSTTEDRKAKLKKKKEAFMKQMQRKGAQLMKHHMESEGISQAEMDRFDIKQNESKKYECPICGESTDHSLANPVGIFVHTRPNNIVSNSVGDNESATDLMDLAPVPKVTTSPGFPKNKEESVRVANLKSVKTKKLWYKERDYNCLNAFGYDSKGQAALRALRFRTGIEVRTCGHFAHLQCFKSYINSLTNSPRVKIDFTISCPYCRAAVNAILPLKAEYGREKIRADFNIQEVGTNKEQVLDFYLEKLKDPRPLFTESDEMYKLNKEYREVYDSFEDIPYRQMNGQMEPTALRFIEGEFKGFNARMGFIQSNVEGMIMSLTLDLPSPSFSKHPVNGHILTGALTQSRILERNVVQKFFQELLDAATGQINDTVEIDSLPPLMICDYQSLFLNYASVPLGDERFVDNDRLDYSKLGYRIIMNLCLTRAIQNSITKCNNYEIVKEFVQRAKFGTETILERCLQKVFNVSQDIFFDAVDELNFSTNNERNLNVSSVEQLVKFTVEQAELISVYFTKFVIILIKSIFKDDVTDMEKMYFRDGVFDNLYSIIYPNDNGDAIQSLANSSRYFIRQLLNVIKFPNMRPIMDTLVNENFGWKYRSVLRLPKLYDKMFSAFFGQKCTNCGKEPKHQIVCLLCGSLMCLNKCDKSTDLFDDIGISLGDHTLQCGFGVCCYLSLNSTMIVINYYNLAVLWGTVYLDAHGEEDRNLYRGKPLYLSENRMKQLLKSWLIQDLDRSAHIRWFNLDQLSIALRQCHHSL